VATGCNPDVVHVTSFVWQDGSADRYSARMFRAYVDAGCPRVGREITASRVKGELRSATDGAIGARRFLSRRSIIADKLFLSSTRPTWRSIT